MQTRGLVVAVYVLAAAVVAAAIAVIVVVAGPSDCSAEARDAAISQDVQDSFSGKISFDEAVNREMVRAEQCGD